MSDLLEIVAKVATLAFVVTNMVAIGLGLRPGDIVAPLRRPRVVVGALVVNFVAVPALAWGMLQVIPLDRPYAIGLLLLASAAGAPFLPKLAELAKGDFALSVGLMLLLTVGNVVAMPIILPMLMPGVSADPWPNAKPLLVTMILPLAVAMVIRRQFPMAALRCGPLFKKVSGICLLTAVVLLAGLNSRDMLGTFGSGAALTAVAFVLLATLFGWCVSGPAKTRSVLALATGQRNIAAALVIATQSFGDPAVTVMLLVATFAGLPVMLIAARQFAKPARLTGGADANVGKGMEVTR